MWNNTSLKPPPTNSFPSSQNSLNLPHLKTSLDELIMVIKYCSDPLLLEGNLLCSFLYKFKTRLRQHVDMKFMIKIKKHLQTFNDINIIQDVTRFLSLIPSKTSGTVYLPTKQMLEYVLIRIQGYSKLLGKLISLSAETAKYMINRLMLGHYWTFALAVLSIVSRIWEICHHITEVCCTCYQNLLPIRNELSLFGTKWLDDNYIFPTDLRKWLELTWTLEDLKSLTNKKLNLVTYVISDEEDDDIQFMCTYKNDCIIIDDSIKLNDNDVEFINEYIDIIDTRKTKFSFIKSTNESIIDLESDCSAESQKKDSDVEIIDENIQHILNSDTGEIVKRTNRESTLFIEIEDRDTTIPIVEIADTDTSTATIEVEDRYTPTPIVEKVTGTAKKTSRKQNKRKNSLEGTIQESILRNVDETKKKIQIKQVWDISTNLNISDTSQRKKQRLNEDNELRDSSEVCQKLTSNKKLSINSHLNKYKSDVNTSNKSLIVIKDTSHIDKKNSTTDKACLDALPVDSNIICVSKSTNDTADMVSLNLSDHNLQNVNNIRDFNKFLATEKILRSKNHPLSITLNLDKRKWKKMIKRIKDIFTTRKQLKQKKKLAVTLAKNIFEIMLQR